MKTWLRIATALAFLALLPGARATTGGINGNWKGAFEFQGKTVALTFHLTAAKNAVTGTVEGLPSAPVAIQEGKLDGNAVSFWLNTEYEGQTYKLVCKGAVSDAGDAMAVTLATEDGSWSTQLTARKDTDASAATASAATPGPDVSGDWKGAFDFNGGSVPLTLHLKGADGVVTGTVEGLKTSPAEIHDGKIAGDTVTFWLNTEYEGQTYKLTCTGKMTSGQIAFSLGTEDGSWSTQFTATKAL
ncbi:MAG TPA: hypothetical protein VGG26_12820 [Terracidiphilus sp.]